MVNNALEKSLLDAFLETKSLRTQKAYRQDLTHFAAFLDLDSPDGGAMVLIVKGRQDALDLVSKYQNFLEQKGLRTSTINRKLCSIRALLQYAQSVGRIDWDLDLPNIQNTSSQEQNKLPAVRRLLSSLDRSTSKGYRDFAILRLIFDLALRRSEIVALDYPSDVDLEGGFLLMRYTRPARVISINLPDQTKEALREWVLIRGSRPGPLFINYDRARKGKRLTGRSVDRNVVKPLTILIGLHLSPERLRYLGIEQVLELVKKESLKLEDVLASVQRDASLLEQLTGQK